MAKLLTVTYVGDARSVLAAQKSITSSQGGLQSGLQKTGGFFTKTFGVAAPLGAAAASAAVLSLTKDVINAASDQGEALNKARVVFGDAADSVIKFSDTSAEAFGISKAAALEAASGFGSMFDAAGLAEQAAGDMSIKMVGLAGDMASFNNQDPTEMLDKLRSGLAGESEPLRRFGVFISDARVKTEAYASGIAQTGDELTDAQKIQARYNIILKDSTKQQGDFGRTLGDSLPNQIRVARASLIDLEAELGTALLPAITTTLEALTGLAEDVAPLLEAFFTIVGAGAQQLADDLQEIVGPIEWLLDHLPKTSEEADGTGFSFLNLAKAVQGLVNPLDTIANPSHLIPWVRWKAAVDTATGATDDHAESLGFAEVATERYLANLPGATGKTLELAAAHDEAAAAARDQRLAILALSDEFLGILDSAKQVADAQRELNRLEQQGKEDTRAYRDAVVEAIGAQSGLETAVLNYTTKLIESGETQKVVQDKIRELASQFGLQRDVVRELLAKVREYIRGLEDIPDNVSTTLTLHIPDPLVHEPPGMAHGGKVLSPGAALVGEHGPEILTLTPGAVVSPLGRVAAGAAPVISEHITINVNAAVMTLDELATKIDEALSRKRRRNGVLALDLK